MQIPFTHNYGKINESSLVKGTAFLTCIAELVLVVARLFSKQRGWVRFPYSAYLCIERGRRAVAVPLCMQLNASNGTLMQSETHTTLNKVDER